MKQVVLSLFLVGLFVLVTQCTVKYANPNDQLPPITQTGAHSFGFKVNGKVWIPAGKSHIYHTNLSMQYDTYYSSGRLNISAYRGNKSKSFEEYIHVFADSLDKEGTYNIKPLNNSLMVSYRQPNLKCSYYSEDSEQSVGILTITKLDRFKGILSGTFEFIIPSLKLECETVEITEGRFDMRFSSK